MADICDEAGDAELAKMIRRHADLAERLPAEVAGQITLVRGDGSRVPLAEVSKHVRFGSGEAVRNAAARDLADARRVLERLRGDCERSAPELATDEYDPEDELDRAIDGYADCDFADGHDDDQDHADE